MTLNELKKEIIRKLSSDFSIKVYGEEVKQGLQTPCFFISITPVTSVNELYGKTRTVLISIKYITAKSTNEELYSMIDSLESVFKLSIKLGTKYFAIDETNPIILDDILNFNFTLTIRDGEEVISIIDEDGNTHSVQPNEKLGYTQESIKFMQELITKE